MLHSNFWAAIYFTLGRVYILMLLYLYVPLFPSSTVSTSPFSIFMSHFFPATRFINAIFLDFILLLLFSCCVWLFVTPWTAAHQSSLSFTISLTFLKLMSIESVIPSDHLVLCHPLLLPSVFLSVRVFSNKSALCIRWPKYWRFSISPSNEYSGFISFRVDWFDFLAVRGTLKSFLKHHSLKASILQHSAFFICYT